MILNPSDSRAELLKLIKERGEMTLNGAAKQTGLSRTTLREHLTNLESAGYIQRSSRRAGRGRPELIFELTEAGEQLFPSQDGQMLRSLLGYLKSQDSEELLNEFFHEFWQKKAGEAEHRLKNSKAKTLSAKIKVINEFLEELGFMPHIRITDSNTIIIEECNCPFKETVKETRLPCKLEAHFLKELFAATLERVTYIPDGNHACTYRLKTNDVNLAT